MGELKIGNYVLACKWRDGDPGDHFALGFYAGPVTNDRRVPPRSQVIGNDGQRFRYNGFQYVRPISTRRGNAMFLRLKAIERSKYSVWHWWRCTLAELRALPIDPGKEDLVHDIDA